MDATGTEDNGGCERPVFNFQAFQKGVSGNSLIEAFARVLHALDREGRLGSRCKYTRE